MSARVPLIVVTGFLGSGKTTLIANWLRHPDLSRSAVIINEFGEIGLDHDLIESSDEDLVELSTGCVCCVMRNDLTEAVLRLVRRQDESAPFERIILETTGLANPGPIIQATMADPALRTMVRLEGVITTVDALTGHATLEAHEDNRRQVALADVLLLTKTDLTEGTGHLTGALARANPFARQLVSRNGQADPAVLLSAGAGSVPREDEPSGGVVSHDHHAHADGHHTHADGTHADGVFSSVSLRRERPVPAVALTLFLQALSECLGPDLLRLKGIVAVAEAPDLPAVVHGVQHVFHPVTWLDAWPDDDRTSRIVVIGRGVAVAWITALFEMVIAEVEAHRSTGQTGHGGGDFGAMAARGHGDA